MPVLRLEHRPAGGFMLIGVIYLIYLIYLYQHDPRRVGLVHLGPLEEYPSE